LAFELSFIYFCRQIYTFAHEVQPIIVLQRVSVAGHRKSRQQEKSLTRSGFGMRVVAEKSGQERKKTTCTTSEEST
jgi:hypothetical protein